jgi:Ran-binding protein 1
MKLQPNIGSDRSWVWKVAADYSEEPPTAETLAIRFANADSWYTSLSVYPDSDASSLSSSGAVQESI